MAVSFEMLQKDAGTPLTKEEEKADAEPEEEEEDHRSFADLVCQVSLFPDWHTHLEYFSQNFD